MSPKVSIIVPIYNMESYLDRCLKSLQKQTLKEIEIIAVNDGSLDSSLELLRKYAIDDSRIIVLDKRNEGVSAARNDGIRAATGEFIGFVDPDDWVKENMYEEMYQNAIELEADIVMCTYIREFETYSNPKSFDLTDKLTYRSQEVKMNMLRRLIGPLTEEVAKPEYLDAYGTVWSKLYRTTLVKDNELKFEDLSVIGSNEDTLFNIHAFYYANVFVFLNRPFYHYWRTNTESITSKYNPLLIEKFESLYGAIQSFLIEKELKDDYEQALNNRISMSIVGQGLNIMNHRDQASARKRIRLIHNMLNNEKISASLKHFRLTHCPIIWKMFFLCGKLKFSAAIYFMLIGINWIRKNNTGGINLGSGNG